MSKIAVIQTGGKQYKVAEGQTLRVEKLLDEVGKTVNFDQVLLVADGDNVKVGTPTVAKATVAATVLETAKGKKIRVIKYKPKTRYKKHVGHRQFYTAIKIDMISA